MCAPHTGNVEAEDSGQSFCRGPGLNSGHQAHTASAFAACVPHHPAACSCVFSLTYWCGGYAGVDCSYWTASGPKSLSEAVHLGFETVSQWPYSPAGLGWSASPRGWPLSTSAGIASMCHRGWFFLHGLWELNSGPHACQADNFPDWASS